MGQSFLAVAKNPTVGTFLTDAAGMTLYRFTKDTEPGISTCYDQCAVNWPPLAPTDAMTVPPDVPGELGTIERTDGGQAVGLRPAPDPAPTERVVADVLVVARALGNAIADPTEARLGQRRNAPLPGLSAEHAEAR